MPKAVVKKLIAIAVLIVCLAVAYAMLTTNPLIGTVVIAVGMAYLYTVC